jgi:hypothetical protein
MSISKREVTQMVLDGLKPPYVPWSFGFTVEAKQNCRTTMACKTWKVCSKIT